MHELGLANSILDLVQQYVPEARAPQLTRVHVRIGEFAGVLPESLSFCFSAIVQRHALPPRHARHHPQPGPRDGGERAGAGRRPGRG